MGERGVAIVVGISVSQAFWLCFWLYARRKRNEYRRGLHPSPVEPLDRETDKP